MSNLAAPTANQPAQLNGALRTLAKWRSKLLSNTLLQHHDTTVWQGPLRGLDFLTSSAEGCHVAKLLGTYEQPLQVHIEHAIQAEYECILNIGCAEGYYAVGMAKRMQTTQVLAFDLDANAQQACQALAAKNGVQDRVSVGPLFRCTDFERYAHQRVLVLCDIEGAERELLDPAAAPALVGMDIIVESHECLVSGVTQLLRQRFDASHHITLVTDDGQRHLEQPPDWFTNLAHLDQLLSTWEWRSGPTPWLVMHAKN